MGNIDVISIYRYHPKENIDMISILIFANIAIPIIQLGIISTSHFALTMAQVKSELFSGVKKMKKLISWNSKFNKRFLEPYMS